MTREDLTSLLGDLKAQPPDLIAANSDPGDFWMEFAGQYRGLGRRPLDHGLPTDPVRARKARAPHH